MADLKQLKEDLVTANRILANQNVLDAFGHVSIRHPDNPQHFLMSRARAPNCVELDDIMEFTLEGKVVGPELGKPYSERFIHCAILEARPDIMSVVHNHSPNVVPFSVLKKQCFCAVMHMAAPVGRDVPNWDIRDKFGDATNLLVTDMEMGRDLAEALGSRTVALMRGHGFASAARSIIEVVRLSVYLPRNARVQMNAMRLGGKPMPLSKGEIAARAAGYKPHSPETWRAWQYWATRAGCGDMIGEPHHHAKAK